MCDLFLVGTWILDVVRMIYISDVGDVGDHDTISHHFGTILMTSYGLGGSGSA